MPSLSCACAVPVGGTPRDKVVSNTNKNANKPVVRIRRSLDVRMFRIVYFLW